MTLEEKIIAIIEELQGGVEKTGKVRGTMSYSYVKGEDIMRKFRELQVKHKIIVLPTGVQGSTSVVPKEGKGFLTTVQIAYKIIDAENPQSMYVVGPLTGQGYDATDKGVYKAMTGLYKYFILQTFSASTDDPEKQEKKAKVGRFNPSGK